MRLALPFAAADLLVGAWLIRHARRRSARPEPALATGIVLLLCAAFLLAVSAHRTWLREDPTVPPPVPTVGTVTGPPGDTAA